MSYQWYFGGSVLSGATSRTLTRTNVSAAAVGTYRIVVQNASGTVNSSNATLSISVPGTPAGLMCFSTAGAATAGGTNWTTGEVVQFGDAGDRFAAPGVTTAGTIAKLPGFVAPAPIRALHYVESIIRIGTTGTRFTLYPGDLVVVLDTGNGTVTLNSGSTNQFTANRQDIVVFRATAAGNYASGTWFMLLNKGVHTGNTIYNVHEVSIVETPTTIGGTTLAAGTFIVAHSDPSQHMNVYTLTVSGTGLGSATQTADCSLLLLGAALGDLSNQIKGLHCLNRPTSFNGNVLPAGTLLVAVNGANVFAGVAQTTVDVVALRVSQTQQDPIPATAATGTLLFSGAGIGLTNTVAKNINSLTVMSILPVATSQRLTDAEDTSLPITLSGSIVNGSVTNFTVLTQPLNGTLIGTPPNLIYTPAPDYFGSDSFTFQVDDGLLASAPGIVAITITPVNDAPVAKNLSVIMLKDTATNLVLTATDVDNTNRTYVILTGPANGTLNLFNTNTGALIYRPATNYDGVDSFTFRVSDGSLFATGLVTIAVSARTRLTATATSPGGNLQVRLSSIPGASFTVLSTTNLMLPVSSWTAIGFMTETSPGQYQFTDPRPTMGWPCFYSARSP